MPRGKSFSLLFEDLASERFSFSRQELASLDFKGGFLEVLHMTRCRDPFSGISIRIKHVNSLARLSKSLLRVCFLIKLYSRGPIFRHGEVLPFPLPVEGHLEDGWGSSCIAGLGPIEGLGPVTGASRDTSRVRDRWRSRGPKRSSCHRLPLSFSDPHGSSQLPRSFHKLSSIEFIHIDGILKNTFQIEHFGSLHFYEKFD
jgi:hypothetical protein